MRIGIIGTGSMGRSMGRFLARGGHEIFFGAGDVARAREAAAQQPPAAGGGSYREAFDYGETLVLTTSWRRTEAAVRAIGDFGGKVLVDCTNPEGADGLVIGHTTSGAEQIAEWAKHARIVKAFNHVYGDLLARGALGDSEAPTLFYCGDDVDAKAVVAGLIEDGGYHGVDAGPLKTARYLEPLSMLMVSLAREQATPGGNLALRLLKRQS